MNESRTQSYTRNFILDLDKGSFTNDVTVLDITKVSLLKKRHYGGKGCQRELRDVMYGPATPKTKFFLLE